MTWEYDQVWCFQGPPQEVGKVINLILDMLILVRTTLSVQMNRYKCGKLKGDHRLETCVWDNSAYRCKLNRLEWMGLPRNEKRSGPQNPAKH